MTVDGYGSVMRAEINLVFQSHLASESWLIKSRGKD